MRIILVYNNPIQDKVVLDAAQKIAEVVVKSERKEKIEITLLHVVDSPKKKEQGELILAEAVQLLNRDVFLVFPKLLIGEESEKVVHEVCVPNHEQSYDLLVIGWRQRPALLGSFYHSATEKILNCVTCPILVVKKEFRPLQRLLICDSGVEDQPLPELMATRLPHLMPKEMEVTILHVMSQIGVHPLTLAWQLKADAEDLIRAQTPEGEVLTRDARLLNSLGIKPRLKIRHGFVVDEILKESKEGQYDLIVIGAHEPIGGIPSLLLEDQAHPIIKSADLPVLLFHRKSQSIEL